MEAIRDIAIRRLQPELMDQPDLIPAQHFEALDGLARLNWWSGSARIVWSGIQRARLPRADRPLEILDLACGSGDVTIGIWQRARRRGVPVRVVGRDRSPLAIQHARQRAQSVGADVRFEVGDAMQTDPARQFDVVVSSLFLHHLTEGEALQLLTSMAATTRQLLLINDLVRCASGLLLAETAGRLLTGSPVVHVDGPRSVAGAFRIGEVRRLAERAGLAGAKIRPKWPFRFLLSWQRTS